MDSNVGLAHKLSKKIEGLMLYLGACFAGNVGEFEGLEGLGMQGTQGVF